MSLILYVSAIFSALAILILMCVYEDDIPFEIDPGLVACAVFFIWLTVFALVFAK